MHIIPDAHSRTTRWKLVLEASNNQSLIIIGSDFNGLFIEDAAHALIHPLIGGDQVRHYTSSVTAASASTSSSLLTSSLLLLLLQGIIMTHVIDRRSGGIFIIRLPIRSSDWLLRYNFKMRLPIRKGWDEFWGSREGVKLGGNGVLPVTLRPGMKHCTMSLCLSVRPSVRLVCVCSPGTESYRSC